MVCVIERESTGERYDDHDNDDDVCVEYINT